MQQQGGQTKKPRLSFFPPPTYPPDLFELRFPAGLLTNPPDSRSPQRGENISDRRHVRQTNQAWDLSRARHEIYISYCRSRLNTSARNREGLVLDEIFSPLFGANAEIYGKFFFYRAGGSVWIVYQGRFVFFRIIRLVRRWQSNLVMVVYTQYRRLWG